MDALDRPHRFAIAGSVLAVAASLLFPALNRPTPYGAVCPTYTVPTRPLGLAASRTSPGPEPILGVPDGLAAAAVVGGALVVVVCAIAVAWVHRGSGRAAAAFVLLGSIGLAAGLVPAARTVGDPCLDLGLGSVLALLGAGGLVLTVAANQLVDRRYRGSAGG